MNDSSTSSGVYADIDAISITMGSYAQASPTCLATGLGTSYNSSYIIGLNGTHPSPSYAELKAGSGDTACVTADFGTRFSGYVVVDLKSATNFASNVTILTSQDGSNFKPIGHFICSSSTYCTASSPQWVVTFLTNDARYVEVSVNYTTTFGASDLYVEGVYIA